MPIDKTKITYKIFDNALLICILEIKEVNPNIRDSDKKFSIQFFRL